MKISIIASLVILAASNQSAAGEWKLIGEEEPGIQFFIDPETLIKGSRPRAWILADRQQPDSDGWSSINALMEANCDEGKIRFVSTRAYSERMATGKQLQQQDADQIVWEYSEPGTVFGLIFDAICTNNK